MGVISLDLAKDIDQYHLVYYFKELRKSGKFVGEVDLQPSKVSS